LRRRVSEKSWPGAARPAPGGSPPGSSQRSLLASGHSSWRKHLLGLDHLSGVSGDAETDPNAAARSVYVRRQTFDGGNAFGVLDCLAEDRQQNRARDPVAEDALPVGHSFVGRQEPLAQEEPQADADPLRYLLGAGDEDQVAPGEGQVTVLVESQIHDRIFAAAG